jgi:hypothetical protein
METGGYWRLWIIFRWRFREADFGIEEIVGLA